MKMDRGTVARAAERLQWPVRVEPVLQNALRWWLGELASFVPNRCAIASPGCAAATC